MFADEHCPSSNLALVIFYHFLQIDSEATKLTDLMRAAEIYLKSSELFHMVDCSASSVVQPLCK